MTKREKWFLDRVGKLIYRNRLTCDCISCEETYRKGLVIFDKQHASYLFECECADNFEGGNLKYFDTIEERDEYENKVK